MRKFIASIIISIVLTLNLTVTGAADLVSSASLGISGANTAIAAVIAQMDNGIVKVAYNTSADKKLKVMVEKSGKRITYNLKNDGTAESFPLQYGNGEYKVSVMENIEGDKYKYVSTSKVDLSLEDPNAVYLGSVQNVSWNEKMAAIQKAEELTKNNKNDQERIKTIYNFIVNNFSYDYNKLKTLKNDYLPDIDSTMTSRKGICYDYASLFAAMLRSQGIPAKLVKGYAENVDGYHAWNEVYNQSTGKWMIIDTTYDSQMKAAKVKYTMEKKQRAYSKVNEY